jgi:phosphoglycolate phosphatase-like HAD superfamily hydrolase
MHVVAFDIDGTLADSYEFDAALHVEAVYRVLGVTIDTNWARYTNATDSGILDEVMAERGIVQDRYKVHAAVQREFTELVGTYIAENAHLVREIPGAKAFMEHLRETDSVTLAIATGCWDTLAAIKLRGIGINANEYPLATASDAISRTEIMEIAVSRAMQGVQPDRVTYFGDGEWDVRASEALGYNFIGIGGRVNTSQSFADFSDIGAISRCLGI